MDLMCMSLSTDMSNNEIKECIQQAIPICLANGQGFCLSISGHDQDRRELWQIPEAISFMKRLCNLGFISALEISTTCPDLIREQYKQQYKGLDKLPGFGALEIWMCGNNKMGSGKIDINMETMNEFNKALQAANKAAELVMKEPEYKTGLKRSTYIKQIPDAPIKHHGFNKDRRNEARW